MHTLLTCTGNEGLGGAEGDGITQVDVFRGTISAPANCKNVMVRHSLVCGKDACVPFSVCVCGVFILLTRHTLCECMSMDL